MRFKSEFAQRAPHVDQGWVDDFVLELRLRDVSGSAIGAAVLEVESHMAAQTGDVEDVFGPPKEYAAALDLPDTGRLTRTEIAWIVARSLLLVLGFSALSAGVVGLLGDGRATLSFAAMGVLTVGTVMLALALTCRRNAALRWIVEHMFAAFVIMILGVVAVGFGTALVTDTGWAAFQVRAWVAIVVGAAMCAAEPLWFFSRKGFDDPITFPRG